MQAPGSHKRRGDAFGECVERLGDSLALVVDAMVASREGRATRVLVTTILQDHVRPAVAGMRKVLQEAGLPEPGSLPPPQPAGSASDEWRGLVDDMGKLLPWGLGREGRADAAFVSEYLARLLDWQRRLEGLAKR